MGEIIPVAHWVLEYSGTLSNLIRKKNMITIICLPIFVLMIIPFLLVAGGIHLALRKPVIETTKSKNKKESQND